MIIVAKNSKGNEVARVDTSTYRPLICGCVALDGYLVQPCINHHSRFVSEQITLARSEQAEREGGRS